ncbi:ABC transporter ATP-binding protein [Treponema sp.]|uniref:ABC transporter ATP-binding protein n=1 Tax=Treponema sp. TaxID=166 RepID=UPI0025E01A62|nr:ABC transporter ATP-binding protein [Treponema sp.]MCR5217055.1 ABC transporter ATP-binding protein/permease [Treponema sp.]
MFKSISPYLGKNKKFTALATILTSIGIIASVIPYYFLYQIIVPLTQHQIPSLNFILNKVIWIASCELLYGISYSLGLAFSHKSAYETLKNIRISLQSRLEKQPLGNIKELGTGQIKKVFTDDIDQLELLLAHAIPEGIANLAIPLVVIAGLFIVDWRLALITLATLPVGIFGMSMMMKSGMSKMGAYYDSAKKMNNTIIEYVNGMEAIKVFNKDGDSFKRFGDAVRSYRDFTLDWYKVCWPWMALYNSVLPNFALFVLPFGFIMLLNGAVTLSQLVLVLCMSFSIGPALLKALSFGGKIPQLNYKIAQLEKLMSHAPVKETNRNFEGKNYDVEFKDVSFTYKKIEGDEEKTKEVLHRVSLKLEQGTKTALIGESGSGKSTLAKLLVHFYDLDAGSISLGGQDITDMSLEALNNQISYVAQEQFLFNTSLYENILIGRPDASREEVLDAAHRAQCDEFLERFPEGIDTKAGDSGKQLSGGERQRISLARAILKNAPVIVLDEATAFMDPENEEKMNAALSEIIKDKTVITIAHRLSSIKNADKICILKEGKILAQGQHDELLKSCAEYQKLWNASSQAVNWKIQNTKKEAE